MIRLGKLILCGLVFGGFIGSSLLVQSALLCASSATKKRCAIRLTQFWARGLIRVLGLCIRSASSVLLPHSQGHLVVSNHQSYLDILALIAHFPVQFVAKHEVRQWPLIGWMAALSHTIFIDRGSIRQSLKCTQQITASLQAGVNVLVFPEGTSTDGTTVRPFKQMLFGTAIKTSSPVLPVTLNYRAINEQPFNAQTLNLCCWYGEMEFIRHFWQVLALRHIEVSLEAHSMLNPPHHYTTQELARLAHEKVANCLAAPSSTTSTTNESVAEAIIDGSSEFLLGAVLLSLVNHETNYLKGSEYGET